MGDHTKSASLASTIDHTLLDPDASLADLRRLVDEALTHRFRSVCVFPHFVRRVREFAAGEPLRVAAVVAFPSGVVSDAARHDEAQRALDAGADELDVVGPLFRLAEVDDLETGLDRYLEAIDRLSDVAAPLKWILQTVLLRRLASRRGWVEATFLRRVADEVARRLSGRAYDSYLKTSDGVYPGPATISDVALLREAARKNIFVKASGGIRTLEALLALRAAGADIFGCSASVAIVTEADRRDPSVVPQ